MTTMSDFSLDSEIVNQIGHDQKTLLDSIDNLRRLGVGRLVDLPQLVVVGDQSSGKSSVLEAISRIRFPIKSGVCTRFATELVLRKKPQEEISVTVINHEQGQIFEQSRQTKGGLSELIEEACRCIDSGPSGYSEDTLRIEISSPTLEPLTLVDLPGFYHAGMSDQSEHGIAVVERIAARYMKQKNTIIVAVISANYNSANQTALRQSLAHDPSRERTMGIITKPDMLAQGDDEDKYVRMAHNREPLHVFKHGWHILRNRTSEENDEKNLGVSRTTDEQRDEKEFQFLSSGVWAGFPPEMKGVNSLRERLSQVLTKHIHLSLPAVSQEIEKQLEARQARLDELGDKRSKPVEMRKYLFEIAERFRDLIQGGIRGRYESAFFDRLRLEVVSGGYSHSDPRKLRAVIRNLNQAFNIIMTTQGSKFEVVESQSVDIASPPIEIQEPLRKWVDIFSIDAPEQISWKDLKAKLELQASTDRGTEFPGSPNDKLALDLFREQSQRWRGISERYIQLVLDVAQTFVELALKHITRADERTFDAIIKECVDPFFERRALKLKEKLNELLRHYESGDSICLEEEFHRCLSLQTKHRLGNWVQNVVLSNLSGALASQDAFQLRNSNLISKTIAEAPNSEVGLFGLERMLEIMTTYYKMCLRTFTDNVIILGVENCLVSEMPSILPTASIISMDEEEIKRLASESPQIEHERTTLAEEKKALEAGLKICQEYQPRKSRAQRAAAELPENTMIPNKLVNDDKPNLDKELVLFEAPSNTTEAESSSAIVLATPSSTAFANFGTEKAAPSSPSIFPKSPVLDSQSSPIASPVIQNSLTNRQDNVNASKGPGAGLFGSKIDIDPPKNTSVSLFSNVLASASENSGSSSKSKTAPSTTSSMFVFGSAFAFQPETTPSKAPPTALYSGGYALSTVSRNGGQRIRGSTNRSSFRRSGGSRGSTPSV